MIVWNEGHDWPHKRRGCGGKVFGTLLGHPTYVTTQLQLIRQDQQLLLDRIPLLLDVQSVWALFGALRVGSSNLFFEGGVPRAVFPVRHISRHALWECLGAVVGVPTRHIRSSTHESVCLLLAFGGLGLRSAVGSVLG